MIYSVYKGSKILRVEHTDQLVLAEGELSLLGDYPPSDYYMIGSMPMPRPEFDLSFNVAQNEEGAYSLPSLDAVFRVEGIPAGTAIIDPSGDFVENDGWYESSFSNAGRYLIALSLFPYKELEVYVEA